MLPEHVNENYNLISIDRFLFPQNCKKILQLDRFLKAKRSNNVQVESKLNSTLNCSIERFYLCVMIKRKIDADDSTGIKTG